MTESRSITHMKCYLFRMAQEKWNMDPSMIAKVFNENKLFDYIADCYDSLHLSSYQLVLNDLETILKNRGVDPYCFKTEDALRALKFIKCEQVPVNG